MNDTLKKSDYLESESKKYPAGSCVIITLREISAHGIVLSMEEAQAQNLEIKPGKIPVKFGMCMSTYNGQFTEEELDEMQQEALNNETLRNWIKNEIMPEVRNKLPAVFDELKS